MSDDLWLPGLALEFDDSTPCFQAIIRNVGETELIIVDINEGVTHRVNRDSLAKRRASGEVKVLAEQRSLGKVTLEDVSEDVKQEVYRRFKYINTLLEAGVRSVTEKSSRELISKLSKELGETPPHWQSVRTWHKRYIDAGERISGLYPKHKQKGSLKSKIDERVVDIINDAAKDYHSDSQPSIVTIYEEIKETIGVHNRRAPDDSLQIPSYVTVRNRFQKWSYQDKQKGRKGKNSFVLEMADANSPISPTRVLQRVEIDHHLVKLYVLDDNNKTLIGRPWLTALMDYHS